MQITTGRQAPPSPGRRANQARTEAPANQEAQDTVTLSAQEEKMTRKEQIKYVAQFSALGAAASAVPVIGAMACGYAAGMSESPTAEVLGCLGIAANLSASFFSVATSNPLCMAVPAVIGGVAWGLGVLDNSRDYRDQPQMQAP